ncbi:MAG: hypothetical protein N2508_06730 [Anaerolineae bacterium]|nr:hypothetical protein [Anaerolineae bacterium]
MGLSVEFFNTVVTPQRLVLVPITKQDMQQAIQTAQAQARAAGKGFFGQWRAQLAWIQVIYEEYRATPVAKLAQKPGSIVFGNQEIRSIRLKDPPAVRPEDYGNTSHYATMNIETTRGRFGFELLTMGAREAREILQQTLGGNVR